MTIRKNHSLLVSTLLALLLVLSPALRAEEPDEEADWEMERGHEEEFDELHAEEREILEEMAEEAEEIFEEDVQAFLRESLPSALELLEILERRAHDADDSDYRFHYLERKIDLGETAQHLMEMHAHDEPLLERVMAQERISIETELLSLRYQEAEEEEREAIAGAIQGLLEEGFEIAQEIREAEAGHIEKELEEIRELLELRQKNKSIIIKRRMYELLHGEDPYAW